MPKEVFFQVVINGSVCSADLDTLRQWVRDGRIGPSTVVTRDDGPPFPLHHLSELKEDLRSSIPTASAPLRMPSAPPPSMPPPASVSAPLVSAPLLPPTSSREPESRAYRPGSADRGDFPNERHRKDSRYISAMKSIRRASWTGLILSVPVLLLGLLALTVPAARFPVTISDIHPGILILGLGGLLLLLSGGLHKGSRVCGALLVLWFGTGFFYNLFVLAHPVASLAQGMMTLLFLAGLIGTFEFHQFRKDVERGNF
jgi:hypothetical protein